MSSVNYLIESKDNPGQDPLIVHVSRIKPYYGKMDEVIHENVTTSGEREVQVLSQLGLAAWKPNYSPFVGSLRILWTPSVMLKIQVGAKAIEGDSPTPGRRENIGVVSKDSQEALPAQDRFHSRHVSKPSILPTLDSVSNRVGLPFILRVNTNVPPPTRSQKATNNNDGDQIKHSTSLTEPQLQEAPTVTHSPGRNLHIEVTLIYSGFYRDEEQIPERRKIRNEVEERSYVVPPSKRCCLKRSYCCLPPTPVYFLENSRRFYQLQSPVLRLLSFTVLQLQENNNSGRPVVKVPTFDGHLSWTSFKTQFDVVARTYGWNVRDKASILDAALRGPTVEVLQMIPEQLRQEFNSLIGALDTLYIYILSDNTIALLSCALLADPETHVCSGTIFSSMTDLSQGILRSAFPTAKNTEQTIVQCFTTLLQTSLPVKGVLANVERILFQKSFKRLLKTHNIKHTYTTPYHPQCNGLCEKVNGTLMTRLRSALHDNPKVKWSTLLLKVVKHYNNTPHDITGFTPSFLLFGYHHQPQFADEPASIKVEDAINLAIHKTRKHIDSWEERHDSKLLATSFEVGDLVLKRIPFNYSIFNQDVS
ncbi:hypothetical protein LAZ67_11001859 [Cordylochernes scorpioides]|uniref:Integrase catalytic domain-containing protein n=1 Tax=Cordylochernes scorpioides TaxID=51811 RepID=A0ABY6KZG0_9ARAC|nr:hypothetical protein LAZ67_11001859 [Cordylochernes scorpioides]